MASTTKQGAPNIPNICKKEKGRDLCLYSSKEYETNHIQEKGLDDDSKLSADYKHIEKKYYTNMYVMNKWSKFIRQLYRNNTLDNFCNKMDDDTYVLGIPASSTVIEHVISSINIEDDEIPNPSAGSVDWVSFANVMDAMDIANFLQIQDILDRCTQVIEQTFPIKVGQSKDGNYCTIYKDGYDQQWRCKIKVVDTLNSSNALQYVTYLFALANYLQNREFNWSKTQLLWKDHIQRLLIAILYVKIEFVSMNKKIKLFHQYVKPGDYAYELFFQIAIVLCSNSSNKKIPKPTY